MLNPRCKICTTSEGLRAEVETRIRSGIRYKQIIEWANGTDQTIRLTKENLSSHKGHMDEPAQPTPTSQSPQPAKVEPPYSFEEIESQPDLNALDIINHELKELWSIKKTRRLTLEESQRLRTYVRPKSRLKVSICRGLR